jgi:hypothetical protein
MLVLPVYDLANQAWLPDSSAVTYRNTLLGHIYPDIKFAIGDVMSLLKAENPDMNHIAKVLDTGFEGYKLIGASGARKHGRVIYALTETNDLFTRFFGSSANAIIYASNFTTECKKILDLPVKLLVVPDDDKTFGVGDCHGKASSQFCHAIAESISNPFQFRAVSLEKSFIAKGTIAYSYKVSRSKYDLVLPESCFKGNKVTAGEYDVTLAVGLVFTSPETKTKVFTRETDTEIIERHITGWDWRKANLSYSVVQFLPWDAVEADILPATKKAAAEINLLLLNQRKLTEYLIRDDEDEDGDDQHLSQLAQVVQADIHGQLSSHPWVVNTTARLFRKRWLRLATAGAIRFNSSMVMPDESLSDDTVCIPSLPEGEEVIVYPYPCRWKHDIRVWRNVHLKQWKDSQGIIALNQQTALKLGRDFDGDYLYWLPAHELPVIADAIKAFGEPSIDQAGIKPKKVPLVGTLGEIAVKSMANDTGRITDLIAKCWAVGREDLVNQLVPQLQAAVDSLKGATPPDQELLKNIAITLKNKYGDIAWLKQRKDEGVYLTDSISDDGRGDTISRLVREVNQFWTKPELRMSKLSIFAPLFPTPDPRWLNRANQVCKDYGLGMWQASREEQQYKDADKPVPRHIADACASKRKAVVSRFEEALANCKTPEQRMGAAAAFWHSRHNCNSNDQHSAYICFLAALPEICERLKELHLTKLHILGKCWSDYPDAVFQGDVIPLRLVPHKNNYLFAQDKDGKYLGCLSVNDSPLFLQDVWFEGEVRTRFDKRNRPMYNEVILVDRF